MRGATNADGTVNSAYWISIHAPHAGCDHVRVVRVVARELISIHAPHAGCDDYAKRRSRQRSHFNPRTPCGVRPRLSMLLRSFRQNFNPRTPCGVRLFSRGQYPAHERFQSTHPMRGATLSSKSWKNRTFYFNPRTPCGVRPWAGIPEIPDIPFQSTHPMRGATVFFQGYVCISMISIHAPHAGCDVGAVPESL